MGPFDQNTMNALAIAEVEAKKRQNTELTPYHLALGFAESQGSRLRPILEPHKEAIVRKISQLAKSAYDAETRVSKELSLWIKEATALAAKEGSPEVLERHFLEDMGTHLKELSLDPKSLQSTSQDGQGEIPDFLVDLSKAAQSGKLDPVIGRTKEIRAVMEILGRRSKNNPVLVGPAGVGKTAIVEGLAGEILKNRVPDVLKGKTIYALDMGSLMAGTKYRGEFEERLQKLLQFIKSQNGEAILFIDEIHQLVGAGRTDGAMDAANLLKPALARGDLHCIGATTPEEFQKYILKDAALERRFRPVSVDEPSKEDAIEIMMGVRDKLESHHGIKISDDAIYASVLLSIQYLSGKQLPDKSIDLIDEAASSLKLSAEAMPADLEQLASDIRAKKILAKVEKDNKQIEEDITAMETRFEQGRKVWEDSVQNIRKHASLQNQLDRSRFELETAERQGDYETASRLKYAVIPELETQIKASEHGSVLGESDVAAVISRQTGIPLEKILKSKQDKILGLYDFLSQRVYGQDHALREISDTLMTSYAGLGSPSRPLGSFLLKGPTGVGKTETAKALSQFLWDSEDAMIRLDMSEYSEKHAVAKLIGAPAGYVGYEEGGVLTEAIRRKPYAILLLDEIEKAHPDFADILLQILDDARLTDNKGRTIRFQNTLIFMTTNSKDIHKDFKPEVLGRLDAVLDYSPLEPKIMEQLVQKQLAQLNERLRGKHVRVTLDQTAMEVLCTRGYDPAFGARPLASLFQRLVTRDLARKILEGNLAEKDICLKWDSSAERMYFE